MSIRLPNIRRMFVPDTGYTICDADLSGADAQVVAWETGDEDLKSAFKSGIKIHVHNSRAMFPDEVKGMSDGEIKEHYHRYRDVKAACHAVNYGASYGALMVNLGWSEAYAKEFRGRWLELHPDIKEWHDRVERHLHGTECWNCHNQDVRIGAKCGECGAHLGRTVKNAFSFRRMFFERIDGQIVPQALAWIPQSTVAFCTELGWTNIAEGPGYSYRLGSEVVSHDWSECLLEPKAYDKWHNIVQFLIQVHDSIVFQVPMQYEEQIPQIVNDMLVRVPYEEPLVIPMGFKHSRVSWGDCG